MVGFESDKERHAKCATENKSNKLSNTCHVSFDLCLCARTAFSVAVVVAKHLHEGLRLLLFNATLRFGFQAVQSYVMRTAHVMRRRFVIVGSRFIVCWFCLRKITLLQSLQCYVVGTTHVVRRR